MDSMPIVILPGLDGTDLLLRHFVELAPETVSVEIITLPDDPTYDYNSLCDKISPRIEAFDSCHLIAESFSGPLGILLAHRHPEIVRRLTLVATFVVSPTPWVARLCPWSLFFRCPMPSIAASHFLVGSDKSLAAAVKNAVRKTSTQTLAKRMRCLMDVDVSPQLAELKCDLHYLRALLDRLVPKRSMDRIVSINSSVAVHEIDGPCAISQNLGR